MQCREGFKKEDISNRLFFFECTILCSLIAAPVCRTNFHKRVAVMRLQLSKKNNPLLNLMKHRYVKFLLTLKTIHKGLLCAYKRQISMLRFTAFQGVRAHKNVVH